MSGYLSDPEKDRFKELMVVSNLRGWQGAGVVVSNNKAETDVFKTVGTGVDMAHDAAFNQRIYNRQMSSSVMIGHTRWPTKGAVTLEATHPHEVDGIVGVHNGTIDSIMGKYIGKDESDSKLLYEAIAEYGVEAVIPEVSGAYALVWIDQKEQTLNFLRNDKRPMYWATTTNDSTMYWASEASMLRFILGRQAGKFEVSTLNPDKWVKFDLPLKFKINETPSTVTSVKSKPAPVVAGAASFFRDGRTIWPLPETAQKTTTPRETGIVNPDTKVFLLEGSTGSTKPSQTTKTPSLPLLPGPKKQWCPITHQWVDTPEALTHPTKTISLGGTKQISKKPETNSSERKESQSTEDPFRTGNAGLSDDEDGVMVGERQFDNLFVGDNKVVYPGYRETTPNNFVAEEIYITYLSEGCMWCNDACADVPSNQWIEADEYMCVTCCSDAYAVDYVNHLCSTKVKAKKVA